MRARAQGAIEYLMIYGWAILAVLIVGLVMLQLGVFDPQEFPVSAAGFVRLKPQLAGTSVTTSGVFNAVFTNTLSVPVYITGVRIVDLDSDSVVCCSHSEGMSPDCQVPAVTNAASDIGGWDHSYLNSLGNSVSVGSGDTAKVELGRTMQVSSPGTAENGCIVEGADSSGSYRLQVEIYYELTLGGVRGAHKEVGTISGTFEQ